MRRSITVLFSILLMVTTIPNIPAESTTTTSNPQSETIYQNVLPESSDDTQIGSAVEAISQDFANDCILVTIDHEHSLQGIDFVPEDFDGMEIESIENLTTHLKDMSSWELVDVDNFHQIIKITLQNKGQKQVLQAVENAKGLNFVKHAAPNYYIPVDPPIIASDTEPTISQPTASTLSVDDIFTDEQIFYLQENLRKIQVPKAWNVSTGSSSVRVGIIDTGIASHPDLNDNVVPGWDFYNDEYDTSDDTNGHGTAVASIVGAKGNNGIGMAGICWNISLVPLQRENYLDDANEAAIIAAIDYAKNNNVPIINCSFGYSDIDVTIGTAISGYSGLVVCAAGNEGKNTDLPTNEHFPSGYDYDNIISVAATDGNDNLCDFSNYGNISVDLAAPGIDIYHATLDGDYSQVGEGTSYAAPHVTGVAALLKSADSTLITRQLKNAIMYGVDEIYNLGATCVTGGRLNAYESMRIIDENMFILKYHANGGSGKMLPTKVPYGVTTTVSTNSFFRSGYDFLYWHVQRESDNKWRYRNPSDTSQSGWYTAGKQPSGWEKYPYYSGGTVSKTINETAGVVNLHAQWRKYFTIKYNANGGSGSMSNTKVPYGVSTKLRSNTFTRSGYDFDCWFIKRSSDGKWRYQNASNTESGWYAEGSQPSGWSKYRYDNGISVSKTVSNPGEVVDFYAEWKQYFTVTYHANGGSGSMANTKVYYGVQTNLRANTFDRSGYDFLYWYAHRKSDNKWRYWNPNNTSETGWYTAGSQPSGWEKHPYYNAGWVIRVSSVPGDVVNLHAQWRKYFTVQYNANGGSGSMANTKVPYGVQTYLRTNTFTRAGYDFDCWYVKRSSDGKWRYRNPNDTSQAGFYTEGSQPAGWEKYPYANGTWVSQTANNPGEVVTFYAQWKKYFIIQYRPNGGTGTMQDTKVYYGVSTATRKNTFLYQGRWFKHWAIQRSSDDKWRYRNPNDTSQSGWYTRGSQPSGWVFFPYSDGTTVSQTVSNPGEIVTFYAQWN